ncbi:hypothetical protein COU96_03045 [Candidatus Shapirobacteria bacterium CG10_big_fil_rev_8_21_14_0_10_38_14]|uniref:Nucleotidyl transferase domain-containing protein n=1 Tax=Candidatus Shapirobacteria bacterium CG10_big_fil_rev_8_21_14_0_10_38_14 TaxID=1974483 RepID=A0A2M8L4S0_9BACT|nr:MAG: hypothetical protein COU96_03045 [Candidatus Shapirobacteria bacterium CG10_big_fil_rev_8_21_14_0_10_38_14]
MIVSISPMAGKAKRLRPFCIHKDIYPLVWHSKIVPVCCFNLSEIKDLGCKRFIFVVKPDKQKVIEYLSSFTKEEEALFVCQETSNGLPYALLKTEPFLTSRSVAIFSMPDTIIYPKGCFQRCFDRCSPKYDLLVANFPTKNTFTVPTYGVDQLDGQSVIWGFILFRPIFLEFMRECFKRDKQTILLESENGEPKFKTFLKLARKKLKVLDLVFDNYRYFDIGNGKFIRATQKFLLSL